MMFTHAIAHQPLLTCQQTDRLSALTEKPSEHGNIPGLWIFYFF